MDTSGIPLTQEAISQTLNDMVKKKSIKLESEDTESKKSKRKSEKARELSAAEKFNQFKKQRIEKKGEGDIVDDLFKDFIAKKMKEIDAERGQGHSHGEGKSKGAKSVQDFSKILDKELKHISYVQPATSETGVKSEVNIKTEKDAFPSVIPLPGEPNSVVTVKKEPEELVFQGPSLPPLNKGDDDVGDMELPVSDAVKSEPKKTAIGFKNFGIKLSSTSTELIKSGDTHKNGKRLEEGKTSEMCREAYMYLKIFQFVIFQMGVTAIQWASSLKLPLVPYIIVGGSRPTAAVLCPWARHFTPRKYWLITQEAMAPSRHDWKIVDWDVKPQHNQPIYIIHVWPNSSRRLWPKYVGCLSLS